MKLNDPPVLIFGYLQSTQYTGFVSLNMIIILIECACGNAKRGAELVSVAKGGV